jgi:hypothetical protein
MSSRNWSAHIHMAVNVRALVNNANDLDAGRLDHVEHHMAALGKTAIAGLHIVSRPTERGIGRQVIETAKENIEVAFRLLDVPLPIV